VLEALAEDLRARGDRSVTDTLLEIFAGRFPERLIGDKGYDGDPPDEEFAPAGIEMPGCKTSVARLFDMSAIKRTF